MKSIKYIIILAFASASLAAHTILLDFTLGAQRYNVTDRGKQSSSIALRDGALDFSAPNSWTSITQITAVNIATEGIENDKKLAIYLRGQTEDIGPFIDIALLSEDWRRANVYRFPIAGLSSTEYLDFVSTTPFNKPIADHQAMDDRQPLIFGEPIGAVQLIPGAETGNRSWELNIAYVVVTD